MLSLPSRRVCFAIVAAASLSSCATGKLGADANDQASIDAKKFGGNPDGGKSDDPGTADAMPTPLPDAPPACVPVVKQMLLNPSFDLTPAGVNWVQQLADPAAPAISPPPAGLAIPTSPNVAWLGGSLSAVDQVSQEIVVPASATAFELKGKRLVGSAETAATAIDTFSISVRDQADVTLLTLATLSNVDKGATATFVAFTFTSPMTFAGKTVKLTMRSQTDGASNTNFFIDDLALNVTACP
jgi:hypothetical protein